MHTKCEEQTDADGWKDGRTGVKQYAPDQQSWGHNNACQQ